MQSPSRSRTIPHLSTYDPMLRREGTYFATLPKELRMEAYEYTRNPCKYQVWINTYNPYTIELNISGYVYSRYKFSSTIFLNRDYIKSSEMNLRNFIRYLESNSPVTEKVREKNRIRISYSEYMDKKDNYLRIFRPSVFYGLIEDEVVLRDFPICDELLNALEDVYNLIYKR